MSEWKTKREMKGTQEDAIIGGGVGTSAEHMHVEHEIRNKDEFRVNL